MSLAAWLTGESRAEFVNRRVSSFRKNYLRDHELEDLQVDSDEFRLLSIEAKHDAEDSYDRWP